MAGGGAPEEEVRDEYVRNMTPSFTPILAPASLPYGSLLSAYSGRCPAAVGWRGRGGWPAGCVAWAQRRFLSRAACTACAAQRGLRSQQPVEMHSTLRGLQLSWHTATHLPHRPSRGWCQSSGPRPRSATGACAAPAPSSPESGLQCKQGGVEHRWMGAKCVCMLSKSYLSASCACCIDELICRGQAADWKCDPPHPQPCVPCPRPRRHLHTITARGASEHAVQCKLHSAQQLNGTQTHQTLLAVTGAGIQ